MQETDKKYNGFCNLPWANKKYNVKYDKNITQNNIKIYKIYKIYKKYLQMKDGMLIWF